MADQDMRSRNSVDFSHELISSRRVEGTPVYNQDDLKLGSIHSVMIEKRSGQVAYAVMATGGLLGFNERVHPIPWDMLTYDVDRDGYVVDLDRDMLKDAPTMSLDDADRPYDRRYDEQVSSYYGRLPWWGL